MIRASGLTLGYGREPVLEGLDLAVDAGEVVALVGGDGAGKTTVLRALSGRLAPRAGTLVVPALTQVGVMPARGAVFGDLTVRENLAFVRSARHLHGADGREADALLGRMDLTEAGDRLASRLSGGMRQKLGLAMALLHGPALLLLDEPTTGVDPVSRAEIWRLLAEEVAEGTAVVMATTYLDEAARSSSVVLLDEGRALPQATPAEVRRRTPGTIRRAGHPLAGHAWRRGTTWHTWTPGRDVIAADAIMPDLEDAVIIAALVNRGAQAPPVEETPADGPHDGTRVTEASPPVVAPDRPSVEVRGVTRRFGTFTAVDAVDLEVRVGEVVGLLGANGAGKTTLIRMLLGLLPPSDGTVELIGGHPTRTARRRVGYVAQGAALYDDLTVAQQRRFHHAAYRVTGDTGETDSPAADTLIGDLSLGGQRRLAFELARAHDPELLVLDEPTSGVGPLGRARLWDQIHDAAERGAAVLVTTHHLSEAEQCDRLVVMAAGQVVARGTVEEIVGDEQVLHVATHRSGAALGALARAGLPGSLAGDGVAVPGIDPDEAHMAAVTQALREADIDGEVLTRAATLEERFVTLVRSRRPDAVAGGAA